MDTEITHDSKYPTCERASGSHDMLLVSSFALWAMLIGFVPVMTYRLWSPDDRPDLPWLIRGSTCGQMRAKSRPGF